MASPTRTALAIAMASLMLTSLILGGCNIVGPALVLIHGPPSFPAEHRLDKDRSTVLFIDDRSGVLPRPILGQQIAEVAETTILAKNLVEDLISARGLRFVTRQESHDQPLSLQEIGRAVGADVLVWITIDSFSLSPDGQTFAPISETRVKVIDVTTGDRIWPPEREGFTRIIRMPTQQGTAPTTRAERFEAQQNLASWTGIGVAQLFFKREVTEDRGRG